MRRIEEDVVPTMHDLEPAGVTHKLPTH
jgi:hypothetical protein